MRDGVGCVPLSTSSKRRICCMWLTMPGANAGTSSAPTVPGAPSHTMASAQPRTKSPKVLIALRVAAMLRHERTVKFRTPGTSAIASLFSDFMTFSLIAFFYVHPNSRVVVRRERRGRRRFRFDCDAYRWHQCFHFEETVTSVHPPFLANSYVNKAGNGTWMLPHFWSFVFGVACRCWVYWQCSNSALQCRSRVIRGLTVAGQNGPLSALVQ